MQICQCLGKKKPQELGIEELVRFSRTSVFSTSRAQQRLPGEHMESEAVVEVPYQWQGPLRQPGRLPGSAIV